ncbi:MAG: hypothetical protein AAF412_09655, partial [Pseudomonadota bacterium]
MGSLLAIGFYLFQGDSGRESLVVAEIERNMEAVLGDDYDVLMSGAQIDFTSIGKISFAFSDINVQRKTDGSQIANIAAMRADAGLLGLLTGTASFNDITIEDAVLDGSKFGGDGLLLPPHLEEPVNGLGRLLQRLESNLRGQGFDQVEIVNAQIIGRVLGRRATTPIVFERLVFDHDKDRSLSLTGNIETGHSKVELGSGYTAAAGEGGSLKFSMNGVSLREWFLSPDDDKAFLAMNNIAAVSGVIDYDETGQAADPEISLKLGPGNLKVGLRDRTGVESADFNIKLFLDRNQIELERSPVTAGRFNGLLIGGIKPVDDSVGYSGPLLYDFIVERGEFAPTLENEPVIPAAFKVAGTYDRSNQNVAA